MLSGIHCSSDAKNSAEIATLVAAAMPPQRLLAALRAAKQPAGKSGPPSLSARRARGMRKARQPAARVSLVSITLEDWRLAYAAESPRVPAGSTADEAASEAATPLAFEKVLALRSVAVDIMPLQRSVTLVLSDLSVTYVEAAAGVCQSEAFPRLRAAPRSHGGGLSTVQEAPTLSPFAVADGSVGCASPGSGSEDSSVNAKTGRTVQLLNLDTITAGLLTTNSAPDTTPQSVHVDVRGIGCRFDTDAVFAAVDVAAELRSVATTFSQLAAECLDGAVAATNKMVTAAAHPTDSADAEVKQASAPKTTEVNPPASQGPSAPRTANVGSDNHFASADALSAQLRRLQWSPRVLLTVALRDIAVEVPVVDSVRFSAKVSLPSNHTTKLS